MEQNQGMPYVGAVDAEIPSGVPWLAEQLLCTPYLIAAGCQQECQTCAWLAHSKSAHEESPSQIYKSDQMWPVC